MEHEAPAIAFTTLSYINRIQSTLSKTVGFKTYILMLLFILHLLELSAPQTTEHQMVGRVMNQK
jgi:hypothetical protein